MSSFEHRRRQPSMALAGLLVIVVVLLVVIGGAVDVGRASIGYRRDVNRSYVAAAAVIVGQSNQEGRQLSSLVRRLSTSTPTSLRRALGSIATATAEEATAAAALAPPAPTVPGLATALAERATAAARLESAVFGLVGLGRSGRRDESAAQAASALVGVGSSLERADRLYASVRSGFHHAPGEPRLPPSRWIGDAAAWSPASVTSLVQAVAGLVADPRVVLVGGTLGLEPAAVPQPSGGTTAVLPPTGSLRVSVVVADEGSGAATAVPVTATVSPAGSGKPDVEVERVSLTPSASVSITFSRLRVVPGRSYTLSISLPASSEALALRVATPT